ncbi:MAG: FG-GAP-like repeat-containing protein [bacterium]
MPGPLARWGFVPAFALAAGLVAAAPARAAFTEAAAAYGLGVGDSMSYSASFPDFDGDGDPDLYVNRHWKTPADFYRNDGAPPWVDVNGRFVGSPPDRHDNLWGDLDDDGIPDQYILHGGDQAKELWWNEGGGVFQEGGAAAGVQDVTGRGREITLIDVDNDGWLDMFVVDDTRDGFVRPSTLYVNQRNRTFLRYPNTQPVFAARLHVAGADFDGDGDPDLVTTNPPFNPGELWRNDGNYNFTNITASAFSGIANPLKQAEGISWADYDNDGDLDLLACGGNRSVWDYAAVEGDSLRWYAECALGQTKTVSLVTSGDSVTVWAQQSTYDAVPCWYGAAGDSSSVFPRTLAIANILGTPPQFGAGQRGLFVGAVSVAAGESVFVAASCNLAGGASLILGGSVRTNGATLSWGKTGYAARPGWSLGDFTNRLYRNDGNGTFTEVTSTAFAVDSPVISSMGGAWGDYDNDGWIDLYVTNSGNVETGNAPDWLYHNNGDGTFTEVSLAEGIASTTHGFGDGAAWADVNHDGFLDLFVDNGGEFPPFGVGPRQLFVNTPNPNHWLEVQLRGLVSNGSGIGARLRVVTPAGVQWRWRLGESDNCFSDQTILHVGLGAATSVDTVQVLWPSGVVDTFTGVASNQRYWAVEGHPLRVVGDPQLSASPSSVSAIVGIGRSHAFTIGLDDAGGAAAAFGVSCVACDGSGVPWLSATPDTGGVWPGGGKKVTLLADMTSLPAGFYCGRAIFRTNGTADTVAVSVEVNAAVGVTPSDDVPSAFFLSPPRPNPSRAGTQVVLGMPTAGRVDVAVVAVDGRRVATLAFRTLPAGRHTLSWNGRDAHGARVAPGVYFVRATSPSGRGTRKVTLLH